MKTINTKDIWNNNNKKNKFGCINRRESTPLRSRNHIITTTPTISEPEEKDLFGSQPITKRKSQFL